MKDNKLKNWPVEYFTSRLANLPIGQNGPKRQT